jgi:signal transduction histidine kinase
VNLSIGRRLEARLVLTVGLGLLLFVLIASLYTFRHAYNKEIDSARQLEIQLVATVRVQAEVATYALNALIAQGVLDGLAGNSTILAARIESADAQFIVEHVPAQRVDFQGFAHATAYALRSPFLSNEIIGTLSIVRNDRHVTAEAWTSAFHQTWLLMAQVLIAAVILVVVLRTLLVKPITRLSHDLSALQPGQSGRLTVEQRHVQDEIGQLAHSANALLDATENAFGKLNQVNQSLALALEKLTEKEASKSRFFATASHDLRQPIHAITLFLDAMRKLELDPEQRRLIDATQHASQALRDLLEALLDMSKLDAGAVIPQPQWLGAETFFERIDSIISPLALQRKLRFKLWYPQRPLQIYTDRQLLGSVLGNLVGNAVKNTVKGGVLVGLRQRHDGWVFQVWDTGVGISAEHIDRIYDEFYQVSNPGRDRAKGLGLGLAIARRISTLLGYTLHCRSQPGRGTVFEVVVPTEALRTGERAVPESELLHQVEAATFAGKRLVVVEDDLLVAQALSDWLRAYRCDVRIFTSGEEALAAEQILCADGFIVDDQLAGTLNGLEFLQALKARRSVPFRAVVVTGNTTPQFIERAKKLGWPVLFKPADPEEILARLAG